MTILVTGALGQDGLLMSRLLLKESRPFVGVCRPGTGKEFTRIFPSATFVEVDLTSSIDVRNMLSSIQPSKIVNFAGFSSVQKAWHSPDLALAINSVLPATILRWIVDNSPKTQFIQASSSEMFSQDSDCPQVETTIHNPRTLYGESKSLAHNIVNQFRQRFGIQANNVILYNHESPLRTTEFVTQHVAKSVAKVSLGLEKTLKIGNLQSRRDWGWAPDYVKGIYSTLEMQENEDFLFATGVSHSVAELVCFAFQCVGIENWQDHTLVDPENQRVDDSKNLIGDSAKANHLLGWKASHDFKFMVSRMVEQALITIQFPDQNMWLDNAFS
jgi:GDPmannose 4,6-dehydratase